MSSKTVEEAWREWLNNTFPSDVLEFDDGDIHASFIAGAAHGRAEGAAEEREACRELAYAVRCKQKSFSEAADAIFDIEEGIRQRGEK